jgi:hypothetical protein
MTIPTVGPEPVQAMANTPATGSKVVPEAGIEPATKGFGKE